MSEKVEVPNNTSSPDVTDRKRAEAALLESEQKFRTIFENVNEEIIYLDKYGRIIDVNERVENIFGYKREEIIGKNFTQLGFFGLKNIPRMVKLFSEVARGSAPPLTEIEAKRKDGSPVFIEASARVVKKDGWIEGILAIIRDITERKQMEEALRQSEEGYRALVNLGAEVGEAIVMVQDTEKVVAIHTFVSDEWTRITGYSREELLTMSMADLIHPRYRKTAVERHQRRIKGESVPGLFEISIVRKDGTEVPVEITAAYTTYKGKPANVIYIRDITGRKRMEEALKESEEKFRTFMETASDLMNIADKDGKFTYVNDSMARTLGYSKEELIGMHITQILTKESLEKDFKPNWDKFTTNGEISLETTFLTKEGKEICCEIKAVAVYDSEGNLVGNRAVHHDVTERKRAEEDIRKFKTIVDNTHNGVGIATIEGEFIYVNESYAQMHGYTIDEVIGKHYSIFYTKEQLENVERLKVKILQKGGYVAQEVWHKRKDGTVFPTLMTAILVKDDKGKPLYTSAVVVDITARKRTEEALRESEEFSSVLLSNASYPLFVINADTSIKYVNPALEKLSGFSLAEVIGKKAPYPWWTEETLPKTRQDFKEAMCKGAKGHEELFKKKNGERFWVSIHATPVIINGE